MKAPENYTRFESPEEQLKKYKEWEFPTGRKNQLPELLYKGVFSDYAFEKCEIVGYTDMIPDEMVVVIHLLESDKYLPIDRRFLKQMQSKKFQLDQNEDSVDNTLIQGKEIKALVNSYVVYDIETTGLSSDKDEIIEIAALRIDNGVITDKFNSLIHPFFEIKPKIIKLTGIDNLMVANAPDLIDVLYEFIDFIDNSILVGHNIKRFDNVFVSKALTNNGLNPIQNDFVDTISISKILFSDSKMYKLTNLIEHYQINSDKQQHRALNDCEYTYQVYEKMKEEIVNKFGSIDNVEKTPTVLKTIPKENKYPKYEDLRKITTSNTTFNKHNPFYEKNCVFTGELKNYSREEAAQIIVDFGGKCENNVTKKTNFLILSDDADPNKKSGKQKKAEEYKLKGQDIKIISETNFYEMIKTE